MLFVLEISIRSTFKTVNEFYFRDLLLGVCICKNNNMHLHVYNVHLHMVSYGFILILPVFIVLTISLLLQIEDFIKAIFADSTLRKECLWRIENVPL